MTRRERIEVSFHGAAGEVTGSCHMLRVGARRILLDCGMIQGGRRSAARNREDFPFDVADIDAVVLSHAHIDHSGRLPLLVRRGYTGPIHAQRVTRDLCQVMLEDSARIAESDAAAENRRRARKGLAPVTPLYTLDDARRALGQFVPLPYREAREILPGVTLRYHDAGHILGSAIVDIEARDGPFTARIVFSGDLGQYGTPILCDPAPVEQADMLIMESTYGDRQHRERAQTEAEIAGIIARASHHHGNILIPAFAVGRTQEILWLLARHHDEWGIGNWRVYLDSPMAIKASAIYWDNPQLYDAEARTVREGLRGMPLLPNLKLTETTEESQAINRQRSGAIIIAGSGMCEGGRILHHLKHNIWREECHVLIVGYQAHGTLGRRLVDGDPYVRVWHETMRVRAQVHTVGGLSAHGDRDDLTRWYGGFRDPPPVWLVHGEAAASGALATHLGRHGAPQVTIAEPGQHINLVDLPAVHRRGTRKTSA